MFNDAQARSEAVNVNYSIILQAPAGSGKTSLLVERFINLLKICQDPSECLAITFSKKAAFEMRYRVLQKLEQFPDKDDIPIYIKALDNPNKLQILTIDAFCANLAKKMPILSRFGLNLKINESPEKLYQEAADQLLTNFDNPHLMTKIFQYFANDYEKIKDLLVDLLYKREQWLPLIIPIKVVSKLNKMQDFDIKKILENNLQQAITDILKDLLNYLPSKDKQSQILNLAKYASNNIKDEHEHNNPIILCKNLEDSWPKADYKNLSLWKGLTELLLTKDLVPRIKVTAKQGFLAANKLQNAFEKKSAQKLKQEMEDLLKYLREEDIVFLSKLKQIINLPDILDNTNSWELLQNLFSLLPQLVAHLMLIFKERQEVDFTQIAISALEAMGTEQQVTDLALFLDYKINHILVDEFQDTSLLQFNLIEKLIADWYEGNGKTIFLVGDPMQSIYRFRQANVNLFIKTQQQGIGNIKLKNLYLNTNFRSTKHIVDNLNKFFVNIFPAQNDIIYSGVAYNHSVAHHNNSDDKSLPINSNLEFFLAEDPEGETEILVDLIQKSKQQHPEASIAILVRTRSHSVEVIKALRGRNIPYQANDIEPMDHHAVINDLVSLTKVILYPQDVIAWLALLRSPLVGLELPDLFYLSSRTDSFKDCLLNQLFNYKDNNNLSVQAKQRLDFVVPVLFTAIREKEAINLSQLIKKTWKSLGGYLFLTQFSIHLAENYFHKLLDVRDIFEIDCIDQLINQSFVQVNIEEVNLKDVQVMTIHKSKGLEFDVVILPCMHKSPRNRKDPLFLWEERTSLTGNYLLFAPMKSAAQNENTIYNFLKLSENERDLHEAKRLLYVAMTRAKKSFYGVGSCFDAVGHNSFLKFLQPYISINNQAFHDEQLNHRGHKERKGYQPNLKSTRIPIDWYK